MKIPTKVGQLGIVGFPDSCPFCHKSITPNPLYGHERSRFELEVLLICPNDNCKSSFIGYYRRHNINDQTYNFRNKVSQGTIAGREFSETIRAVSEKFEEIYNQAFSAEQQNLTEICGVGYRKALEFLIKDYAITKYPDEKEKIKKKMLGICINEYVEDSRIKTVAKRAVWLGNDETHYVRRWEGKNLEDLKKLIDLTLHWVEMEKLTESFEAEMPEK